MVAAGIEGKLTLDDLLPLEDDGTPRECACCALSEGRTPKRYAGPSLTRNVMELVWPFLERIDRAAPAVWEFFFLLAAQGWNLAVERKANPAAQRRMVLEFSPTGSEIEVSAVVAELAERKEQLFPDDVRYVEEVRFSAEGEVWCKPRAVQRKRATPRMAS